MADPLIKAACKKMCIEPEELVARPFEDFRKEVRPFCMCLSRPPFVHLSCKNYLCSLFAPNLTTQSGRAREVSQDVQRKRFNNFEARRIWKLAAVLNDRANQEALVAERAEK